MDARLDQVECVHIELTATLSALKHDEQQHWIKSLEDDRTSVKAWAALIALLGSIGAFIAGHFCPPGRTPCSRRRSTRWPR